MRAQLLEALGNTLRRTARPREALDAYDQAEQLWRGYLGPEHPYLSRHDYNLGLLLTELGQTDAAGERLERARARWVELYGPNNLLLGRAELALAELYQVTRALDDALVHVTRGREIVAATRGPDDPVQVEALQALGLVQFRRGDLRAAHDAWQQALEKIVATRGTDDPDASLMRSNVAETLLGLGEHARARTIYTELLPAVRTRAELEPLILMLVLKGLGLAELGAERPAEALPLLREALELLDRHGGHALERADLQSALARAEHGAGEPLEAVRARAEEAAEIYAEHDQAERADEIRTWLTASTP